MTDLYETLCVVRTAIVNSIGEMTLTGKVVNYSEVLSDVADELSDNIDFMDTIQVLDEDELLDLGFQYLNSDESDLMLFPLWLYPFIPKDTELTSVDEEIFVVGEDVFEVYADNWVCAGFFYV